MSYPQPLASQEVLEGQEFFRLNTVLATAGDVYEMDVSAKAFVIGPQSDISRVRVTYWDPQAQRNVQSFTVTMDDPFLGRIDANLSEKYPGVNTPANILISPEDYFAFWQPSVLAQDIVANVNPRLDLIAYNSPPTSIPAKRDDFVQKGRLTIANNGGPSGLTTLLYPYFRRKFASIIVTNFPAAAGYAITVTGLTFTSDGVMPLAIDSLRVQQTVIVNASAIPATATTNTYRVRGSVEGLFDYLMIQFTGAPIDGAATFSTLYYTVRFTDEEV